VIRKDALQAIAWTRRFGNFKTSCNSDERSVERSARSGVVQPVMRSLRLNHGRLPTTIQNKTRETVRAERTEGSGGEHGRPTIITENRKAARKHPVTEQCEVAVLTSVYTFNNEPNGWDRRPRLRGIAGDPSQADRLKFNYYFTVNIRTNTIITMTAISHCLRG
jgi:hypothetical protein